MPDVVQWGIDEFWAQLQALNDAITGVHNDLNADKAQLTSLYSQASRDPNPVTRAASQALLQPLIHQNSVLRLSYLQPVKDKFNQAVQAASSVLRSAGYTTPTLSGLGIVPLVPVIAVSLVVAALAAVVIVHDLTQAQRTRTQAAAQAMAHATTPQEILALTEAQTAQQRADNQAHPPLGFDFGSLVLPLGLVAAIVLLPSILKMLPKRSTA